LQTSFQGFLLIFSTFNPLLLRFPGLSPRWLGFGYHLWFLGFLFCFALITLPFFFWLKKKPGLRFLAWMANLCEHRGGLLLCIIPFAVVKLILASFAPLEHDWADFIFQMCFFALGYILLSDERFTRAIRRDRWILLTIPTVIILGLLGMYLSDVPVMSWYETPSSPQFYLLQFFISIIAFCYSLTMLFVGMRFLNFNNRLLRYGQEAALPFFVLHQPVIIVIAFFIVQWDAGISIKLPIVVLASFVISIGLYELIIQRIYPLRIAFGMKSRTLDRALSGGK
jgi:glucan biosynthesis protein C